MTMKTIQNNTAHYKSQFLFLLLLSFALMVTACTKDDDVDDIIGGGNLNGEVTFTVTGDMQRNFTGYAFFSNEDGNWELYMADALFLNLSNLNFNLTLNTNTEEPNYRPGTGTYSIAKDYESEIFSALFEFYENGFDPEGGTLYATYLSTIGCPLPEHGGTLTISASSADEIRGSFEMTLLNTDQGASCEPLGEINVKGTFKAVNVD